MIISNFSNIESNVINLMSVSQIQNLCTRFFERSQYKEQFKVLNNELSRQMIRTNLGFEMWAYPCSLYGKQISWVNQDYVVAPGYEDHSAIFLKIDHINNVYEILEIIGNLHFNYLNYLL